MWSVPFQGIKQLKFTLMNGLYVKKSSNTNIYIISDTEFLKNNSLC